MRLIGGPIGRNRTIGDGVGEQRKTMMSTTSTLYPSYAAFRQPLKQGWGEEAEMAAFGRFPDVFALSSLRSRRHPRR